MKYVKQGYTSPIIPGKVKILPNSLCPCQSGKKYKKCHGIPRNLIPMIEIQKEDE